MNSSVKFYMKQQFIADHHLSVKWLQYVTANAAVEARLSINNGKAFIHTSGLNISTLSLALLTLHKSHYLMTPGSFQYAHIVSLMTSLPKYTASYELAGLRSPLNNI